MSEATETTEAAESVEPAPATNSDTSPGDELFASQPAPEKPDLSEQMRVLEQKIDAFARTPEPPEPDTYDVAQGLLGEVEPDPYYEAPEQLQEQYAEYEPEPHPIFQEIEGIKQYLNQQAEAQRMGELGALVKELPELQEEEMQAKIGAALEPLVGQYGQEIMLDPGLLRMTYRAIKAEAASANEVPAEEARNRGASLETNAGARAGSDELDESEAAADAIVRAGPGRSVFG